MLLFTTIYHLETYLIFLISFTQAKFSENKIYTEKRVKGWLPRAKLRPLVKIRLARPIRGQHFRSSFFFFLVRFDLLISVRTVVEDSVREQRMNPFISPFPLEKD